MGQDNSAAVQNPSPALYDPLLKARLALSARIASGIAANPHVWGGPDPQGTIARESWAIAGRLILLAESGGC